MQMFLYDGNYLWRTCNGLLFCLLQIATERIVKTDNVKNKKNFGNSLKAL